MDSMTFWFWLCSAGHGLDLFVLLSALEMIFVNSESAIKSLPVRPNKEVINKCVSSVTVILPHCNLYLVLLKCPGFGPNCSSVHSPVSVLWEKICSLCRCCGFFYQAAE